MLENNISHLFARPIVSIVRLGGGGNSRIFQVKDADGKLYALKSYPPLEYDPRDRLGTEFNALNFLRQNSEVRVPQPVSMDRNNLLAVYEWIDGSRPVPSEAIIDAMLDFTKVVYRLRENPDASTMPLASECCLSGADILGQVRNRMNRLRRQNNEIELQDFLLKAVEPVLAGLEYSNKLLPASHWCLTPGDFGFHNMLVSGDEVAFVDMEYFGWDDPVKQVCDVIWHPGMSLSDELASRFLSGAMEIHTSDDSDFCDRVKNFFPAYGLRWTMILLNEFLPERWALRAHAGAENQDYAKERQFDKARKLFQSIKNRHAMVIDTLKC